ncbi:MAG: hypothetical protein M9900_11455 [Flavobacteriales bacterium]|nr:hypothetical protein [Flavobacteriales bacterium]
MSEHADIYVAIRTRSKQTALEFLDYFIPKRKVFADEFEFPQYSQQPDREFSSAEDVMDFLQVNTKAKYNLYWKSTDDSNPNLFGMLFYTKDEAIIFGITRDADIGGPSNTDNESECLRQLEDYFKTSLGYVTYEDTPYETFEEFQNEVMKKKQTHHNST